MIYVIHWALTWRRLFLTQITYPNGLTSTSTQQIQAEHSSSRTEANELLHFSAFRIDVGPNLVVESENHSKQAFLLPPISKNVNNKDRVSGRASLSVGDVSKTMETPEVDAHSLNQKFLSSN